EIACAAQARELGGRPERRQPHVEALAPCGKVAESVLMLATEVDAEDPALGETADHPSHPVGRVLDIDPTAPTAAALGEEEHGLSAAEQVDEAAEHAGDLAPVPTARHRHALHEVDEDARRQ